MSNLRPVDPATERAVLASYLSIDLPAKSTTYARALERLRAQVSPTRASMELREQLARRGLL